ncbi:hypothetical protein [Salinimonas chungwhensis]|uniref:hypothetical protein n=1 Tax=Salinimonas chungwhensis TaxID=265425 RepID=UPI000378A89F|nr:hypothetical protein [Salinimonas chungwhensis]
MKKWGYGLLVLFIAVAAYQFGYYQNKLSASEQNKQRLFGNIKEQQNNAASAVMSLTDIHLAVTDESVR